MDAKHEKAGRVSDASILMRLYYAIEKQWRRLTYRVLCAIDDAGFMGIK